MGGATCQRAPKSEGAGGGAPHLDEGRRAEPGGASWRFYGGLRGAGTAATTRAIRTPQEPFETAPWDGVPGAFASAFCAIVVQIFFRGSRTCRVGIGCSDFFLCVFCFYYRWSCEDIGFVWYGFC